MISRKGKSQSARWQKNGEEEFEGIIHLGKDKSQKKRTESRWEETDREGPARSKKKGAESRWESQQNEDSN